jgi:transposase
LDDDVETIINISKRRWEIEESFRIMKSEFKARPVYLKKDERIEAHFLTCFLSLLILRILENKIDYEATAPTLIKTLKNMNFNHHAGSGYIPTYTRDNITDLLHEKHGFRTDTQIVPEKNMKLIIKSVKK